MSYAFYIHDIQVFVVLECGVASLDDWYPTFRDSVRVFERRHPMPCRHTQHDGDIKCIATNAYKFGFICLFEEYKILHFYLFFFFVRFGFCISWNYSIEYGHCASLTS